MIGDFYFYFYVYLCLIIDSHRSSSPLMEAVEFLPLQGVWFLLWMKMVGVAGEDGDGRR